MSFRSSVLTVGCACVVAISVVAIACSSSSTAIAASGDGGDTPDAMTEDGGTTDAKTAEAASDGASAACEGTCKTTALVVDIGGKKRTLSRAQFGTQLGTGGRPELHTESHLGGQVACPSQASPSPDYTLIVTSVPRGATG